jgi:hypothetical protein
MRKISQTVAAPPNDAGFIDEQEMLRRLPISRGTLFNWRKAKKIPSVVIGRRVLFKWELVQDAILRGGQ